MSTDMNVNPKRGGKRDDEVKYDANGNVIPAGAGAGETGAGETGAGETGGRRHSKSRRHAKSKRHGGKRHSKSSKRHSKSSKRHSKK